MSTRKVARKSRSMKGGMLGWLKKNVLNLGGRTRKGGNYPSPLPSPVSIIGGKKRKTRRRKNNKKKTRRNRKK